MNVFELFGTIAIDHSEAERGLDKTVRHARDAENALAKTFKRIGGYVAAAFSVSAIVNFGKTCTQVYADVAAEEAAFAQIMGDYADTAQDKLDAVADKTGITSTRMTSAFNSLTAKFKGLGYSTEDATTLAADGLMIAADASAFWNMSLDEAMAHLNSFINGSYEGGEAIGLFANDTQMAAYAIEKGIVADAAAWAQLDEATKQAVRIDFARTMQANSGVTGQAAAEAGSFANVLGNLQEAWRQLQAVIGKPILEKFVLPAMQKLNEFLPVVTENVQKGIDWLTEGFDKITAYFSEVFTEDGLDMNALPNALRDMFRDVSRAIPALLSSVGRSIRNAWVNTVWPAVQGAFKMVFGVELPEWSKIESAVIAWWNGENGIASKIASVCNWVLNLFGAPATVTEENVSTILSDWWEDTKGLVSSFCDWTLKLFSNPVEAVEDVKKTVKGWWTGVKSGAESALDWVLKLFGVPEAKAEDVKNLVSGWWQGMKTAAQGALIWTLKLFENPKETLEQVQAKIGEWWTSACTWVSDACAWVLNLFDAPADVTEENVSAILSAWWSKTVGLVQDACQWVLNMFGVPGVPTVDGLRNMLSTWWNGVKTGLATVCSWTLSMFGIPEGDPVAVVTEWWKGIRPSIESALDIDLSSIDIAGIFTAASTAIDNVIEDAKTFCSDVSKAIAWDMSGRINLGMTLSNLFNAGVTAIGNLLGSASTLVGDIVTAVTGDEEAGKKIGGVFSDLFSWASDVIIGVKDGAIVAFQWLIDNQGAVVAAFSGVAAAMLGLAVANPATGLITALIALIATMSTDWENFEEQYPQLVDMFEDLTGLDFTTVADSLAKFKSGMKEVFDYLSTHDTELAALLALFGGFAMYTGHPIAGVALLAASGYMSTTEVKRYQDQFADDGQESAEGRNVKVDNNRSTTGAVGQDWMIRRFFDLTGNGSKWLGNYKGESESTSDDWLRERFDRFNRFNDFPEIPSRKYENRLPLGAPADADVITYDTENLNPAKGMGMMSLVTMMQTVATQIKADVVAGAQEGVAAGLSGVTIKANVTTGDIKLDDGTLVGSLTPHINFVLGAMNARSGRV